MSDDPDPDLGSLGVALPLPYRVGLILVAGMSYTWADALKLGIHHGLVRV